MEVDVKEVPFGEVLTILQEQGRPDDAATMREAYIAPLNAFGYTEEQILALPLGVIEEAVQALIEGLQEPVPQPAVIHGNVLTGAGADGLNPRDVAALAQRQQESNHAEIERIRRGL